MGISRWLSCPLSPIQTVNRSRSKSSFCQIARLQENAAGFNRALKKLSQASCQDVTRDAQDRGRGDSRRVRVGLGRREKREIGRLRLR